MAITNWLGAVDGSFSIGTNWDTQKVPGDGDSAAIAVAGSYTVTVDTNFAVDGLSIADALAVLAIGNPATTDSVLGDLANSGTLTVDNGYGQSGSTLDVDGALDNSGTIDIDTNAYGPEGNTSVTVTNTVTNTGILQAGNAGLEASSTLDFGGFDNMGMLILTGNTTPGSAATMTLYAGLKVAPDTLSSTIELIGNAVLIYASGNLAAVGVGGDLLLEGAGAQIDDAGRAANSAISLSSNAGTIDLEGGASLDAGAGTLTNTGALDIDDFAGALGSTLTLGGLINTGQVETDGNPYAPNGGTTLVVDGTLDNRSSFAAGTQALAADSTIRAGSLVNSGTIVLAGTSGYNTTLTVQTTASTTGTITVRAGGVLDIPSLDIATGGDLDLAGGAVSGPVSIESGGQERIEPDASAAAPDISGGTLEIKAGGTVTSAIDFTAGGTLQIDGMAMPANVIDGFLRQSGQIVLESVAYDPTASAPVLVMVSGMQTLEIAEDGSTYDLLLDPGQSYADDTFSLASDNGGGTVVSVACYGRSTLLLTDRGEIAVEHLAIGDRMVTASGRSRPIRWIGRRAYAGRFLSGQPQIQPICFKAGSLGLGTPRQDLLVSPNHAMFVDGLLVPARCLINGTTIIRQHSAARVEYFHVELDTHDIIFAEGAQSETFLDDGSRGLFHNYAEYALCSPARRRAEGYCAPRVEGGFGLEAIRRRLTVMPLQAQRS